MKEHNLLISKRDAELLMAAVEYFSNDIRDGEPLTANFRQVYLNDCNELYYKLTSFIEVLYDDK